MTTEKQTATAGYRKNKTIPEQHQIEWGVMSRLGQVHIEADRNLAEISVAEFRIHGQPAHLVSRTNGGHWEDVTEKDSR